jgi:hypothetical protein
MMWRIGLCGCLVVVLGCTRAGGPPDPCVLLRAADPGTLLRAELGPDRHIYGLCRIDSVEAPAGPDEKSVGLELRHDRDAAAVANLDQFWDHEGAGVEYQGGAREHAHELAEPGGYTVWFPIDGGLQLFSYWDEEHILVISVKGAPAERILPWARALAGETVRTERASRS